LKSKFDKILKACQRNDKSAQQALYDMFVDRLYYVILRYVNDQHHTQELLQDVFIKAFQNIHSFNPKKGSFNTWIHTIAINHSLSYCRKKKHVYTPIEEAYMISSNLASILSELEAEDILKTIAQLPDKYRIIFNLYEIDGFNHKEIAEMLNIKEGTSRSYLTRSKEMIKDKIALIK